MNKTELIAAVAEKASISKKESEVVINAALDTIIRLPEERREGPARRLRLFRDQAPR